MSATTCSKTYKDIPFAHRQHLHAGHCALIHGHNWDFTFEFGCTELDDNGFVVDFGRLKFIKELIDDTFDHALVLNADDPFLNYLTKVLEVSPSNVGFDTVLASKCGCGFARIVTVPNCGAEGLCAYLAQTVGDALRTHYGERVFLTAVTVHEDSKNTATLRLR